MDGPYARARHNEAAPAPRGDVGDRGGGPDNDGERAEGHRRRRSNGEGGTGDGSEGGGVGGGGGGAEGGGGGGGPGRGGDGDGGAPSRVRVENLCGTILRKLRGMEGQLRGMRGEVDGIGTRLDNFVEDQLDRRVLISKRTPLTGIHVANLHCIFLENLGSFFWIFVCHPLWPCAVPHNPRVIGQTIL